MTDREELVQLAKEIKDKIEAHFTEVVEGDVRPVSQYGIKYATYSNAMLIIEGEPDIPGMTSYDTTDIEEFKRLLTPILDNWLALRDRRMRLVWRSWPEVEIKSRMMRVIWRSHTMPIEKKEEDMNREPKEKAFMGPVTEPPKGAIGLAQNHFEQKVLEQRGSVYGDYRVNMRCVADLWSSYLTAKFGQDFCLTAADVPVMMQLLKVGRIATGKYHEDNQKDIKGYGELYDKIMKEQGK